MGIMKNKIIYFAILASIVFLNALVFLKIGAFTDSIPKSELDLIFFMIGFATLLSSLVLPRILEVQMARVTSVFHLIQIKIWYIDLTYLIQKVSIWCLIPWAPGLQVPILARKFFTTT